MTNFGYRIIMRGGLLLATLAFIAATVVPSGATAQGDRGGRAIGLAQDAVRLQLERSEGQGTRVDFNNDAAQQSQGNRDSRVTGTGVVWSRNRRRNFSYQATVNARDNSVYSVRNDWRGGWVNDNSGGGGGGGWRPGGGGRSIELAQDAVRLQLERSEGQGTQVRFNEDANQQSQGNRDSRVTGTGVVWSRNRRRDFSYQATVNARDNSVYSVRNDWRGGWVNDNSGGGGGWRPGGGGGGRPPWDGGGGGGNVQRPNGSVRYSGPITNAETGKTIDVAGWSREDGANVQQWSFAGQRNQRWDVIDVGRGQVAIVSQNSGRVLDVSGFSSQNGGNIQQYRWSTADNQRWRLDSTGRGFYRIVSVSSGKCVDVERKSHSDGANIHQWDCNNDRSQQWRLGN